MKQLFSLILVSLLVGCGTQPTNQELNTSKAIEPAPVAAERIPPPAPAPAPPPPPPLGGLVSTGSSPMIPVRDFLYSTNTEPDNSSMLQSFVVFTHRPSDKEEAEKYVKTCQHWSSELELVTQKERLALSANGFNVTPLYWLSKNQGHSCNDLFNYDYLRAAKIAARSSSQNLKGPLLVLQRGSEWLVLDVSRFTPPDVERAFSLWKSQVCSEDPTSKMSRFREYFRALVQTYGKDVLKSLEKMKVG